MQKIFPVQQGQKPGERRAIDCHGALRLTPHSSLHMHGEESRPKLGYRGQNVATRNFSSETERNITAVIAEKRVVRSSAFREGPPDAGEDLMK